MVQLNILSGKQAGNVSVARRFPVRIGRSAKADLRLEEPGVWDEHLELNFDPAAGIMLRAAPNALVSVNGQTERQAALRSGDAIDFGSVKLRFWLSEAHQSSLRLREWLTWVGLAAITLGQVALIYWLLK